MIAKVTRPRLRHASVPRRLNRVRKTGKPTWGLHMVAGSSNGKNPLAAMMADHCTVRSPAQYG